MTVYRVIGIDPALTNVGLCVLESKSPSDYRVIEHWTVSTSSKHPMLYRLGVLRAGIQKLMNAHWDQFRSYPATQAIVIEDPTWQNAIKRQKPRNIAVMGMAVGAVVGCVMDYATQDCIHLFDPDEWMPRVKTGRLEHIMEKGSMVRHLHSRIRIPEGASEHVVMAAGVARYWVELERSMERLRA